MSEIAIIGGGLTGLVAAERLAASGVEAHVYDREAEPGGACRSFVQDGFTFDLTGHLLHVRRQETRDYLERIGVWAELQSHVRRAAVVVRGCVTPYPIQIHTHGLPADVRRDCLLGFIRAWAGRSGGGDTTRFSDWVLRTFGAGLADHFFFPYNTKLFRADPRELATDWVADYVPQPNLEDVVDGALGLHDADVGYNAQFHYPRRTGIRLLPDAVAERVSNLHLEQEVVRISLAERWLELADGERRPYEQLVVTAPLTNTIDMVVDELSDDVLAARAALRWVRVVNVALGVRGVAPVDEHWLYFPDPNVPYYRVGFPSNHGRLAPEDAHTVSIEVSLDPTGDDPREVASRAEAALAGTGWLDPAAVATRLVTVLDPAYVVFDHRRRAAVDTLRRALAERDVYLAGRWAEWKYSAMEDAVNDGISVARRVVG